MNFDNTVVDKLDTARKELLDLSGRNRLLNTPRGRARSTRLDIVDELSEEVFRLLVKEGKSLSFLPGRQDDEVDQDDQANIIELELLQPDDEGTAAGVTAPRHLDNQLQTRLESKGLQNRLLKLHYDARTSEEEQGVNVLYLALGFLKWYEADNSDRERFAPLILIPVELERKTAKAKYRVKWTEEDIATNISLKEKLRSDFHLTLPDIGDIEDFSPTAYFEKVREQISGMKRWEAVPNDIVLWLFSFAKFLMYLDLQPENWPDERAIERHSAIQSLLSKGFSNPPSIFPESGDVNIDSILDPKDLIQILDADSSQTIAIEEVKQGRSLVIQGPPGTGKSQTIANMIAALVHQGKRVLFVAEKMAALEVVKRRLDNVGLGDMCLELHSHKANKRSVIADLKHTLELGRPMQPYMAKHIAELRKVRDQLNRHVQVMHTPFGACGISPFKMISELVRLRAEGTVPPDFAFTSCGTWTEEDLSEKRRLVNQLARLTLELGNPQESIWRGVRATNIIPPDIERLRNRLPGLIDRIDQLSAAGEKLAALVCQTRPSNLRELSRVAQIAKRITGAPPVDRSALSSAVWKEGVPKILELIQVGKHYHESRQALSGVVADVAWETDMSETRRHLAAYGNSLFRFFNRKYRNAQASLRGIMIGEPPKDLRERIKICDSLIQCQKARRFLEQQETESLGQEAFGSNWRQAESDWQALASIVVWVQSCQQEYPADDLLGMAAQVDSLEELEKRLKWIGKNLKPYDSEQKELATLLDLSPTEAFGQSDIHSVPLNQIRERFKAWLDATESVTKWRNYFVRQQELNKRGLEQIAERIDRGLINAAVAFAQFELAFYEQLFREATVAMPELIDFNGTTHNQTLLRFRALDKERLVLARAEVASAHFLRIPNQDGNVGEIGVLRRECEKKTRHMPIRKLLEKAGHMIQELKPVMMMSPISVAQFLTPGILEFDALLIDEASQVRPVEALGAIARAKQLVVVGDDKQMPPTSFFSKMTSGGDEEDAEDFSAKDVESVLGLCNAQGLRSRMLEWHYRSRHHSLIAVSNREFYSNRLFVVPSPTIGNASGLVFRHVGNGVFDRGGKANNVVEARAVAQAVIDHARQNPKQTLGVGTFSVSQQDAIRNELELLRRENEELESFFAEGTAEPFFIKNLENLQGDERDVIFISVGYGRDSSGFMSMGFGPLSNEGGERRLNVLISRARFNCQVFSSVLADDIDLARAKSKGARVLKTFLSYAKTGILDIGLQSNRDFDSEFEVQVAKAIEASGFEVDAQIGVAGFFVDLAVKCPERPGRYLLGVECDGAAYHSSRWARDRDRLRQQVLEDRGWIIHRIWSSDWFYRPEEELRKALVAIENAKSLSILADDFPLAAKKEEQPLKHEIRREETDSKAEQADSANLTAGYFQADFPVPQDRELVSLPPHELARFVKHVIDIESPIHHDEVIRRVSNLWGYNRSGKRISEAIENALDILSHQELVVQEGPFYLLPHQNVFPVRNRQTVISANLRKAEYIPPQEIRTAILEVITNFPGSETGEIVSETTKLFGFKMRNVLKDLVEHELSLLLDQQIVDKRNEKFYAGTPASQRKH